MNHLTEALEVASDVEIEFQSFILGLEFVPEKGIAFRYDGECSNGTV